MDELEVGHGESREGLRDIVGRHGDDDVSDGGSEVEKVFGTEFRRD